MQDGAIHEGLPYAFSNIEVRSNLWRDVNIDASDPLFPLAMMLKRTSTAMGPLSNLKIWFGAAPILHLPPTRSVLMIFMFRSISWYEQTRSGVYRFAYMLFDDSCHVESEANPINPGFFTLEAITTVRPASLDAADLRVSVAEHIQGTAGVRFCIVDKVYDPVSNMPAYHYTSFAIPDVFKTTTRQHLISWHYLDPGRNFCYFNPDERIPTSVCYH